MDTTNKFDKKTFRVRSFRKIRLRHQEYFVYARALLAIVRGSQIALLDPFTPPMQTLIEQMDKALRPIDTSLITQDLRLIDQRRDQVVRQMRKRIAFGLLDDDPTMVQAAQLINNLFRAYGANFSRQSFSEQTGRTHSFLTLLAKKPEAQAIETLDLQGQISALRERNNAFEELYNKRITLERDKPHGHLPSLRKDFDRLVRMLINYIEILAFDAPTTALEHLASDLGELHRQYATITAMRAASALKKHPKKLPTPDQNTSRLTD